MPNDDPIRDILDALLSSVLRIETRLDGHDQRFDEQREQINSLTDFTVNSLNSIDQEMRSLNGRVNNVEQTLENLDHRALKLEMTFEDFRSDTRVYWVHLSDNRTISAQQQEQLADHKEKLADHELRITRLEAS